jgi:hypothetical protein
MSHVEDEKVKTIGHVAASLVHEVRNPQVIRALGGSISVQSKPGLGTVFKVTFLKAILACRLPYVIIPVNQCVQFPADHQYPLIKQRIEFGCHLDHLGS